MVIKFGYNEKYFTELLKIEDFSTIDEFLEIINKEFDYDGDWEYLTIDELSDSYPPKPSSKYAQVSDDGTLYFVDSLDEFNEKWASEEKWGVKFWKEHYFD